MGATQRKAELCGIGVTPVRTEEHQRLNGGRVNRGRTREQGT